jgi:hypothetical protein
LQDHHLGLVYLLVSVAFKVQNECGVIEIGANSVSQLNFNGLISVKRQDEAAGEAGVELSVVTESLELLLAFSLAYRCEVLFEEAGKTLGGEALGSGGVLGSDFGREAVLSHFRVAHLAPHVVEFMQVN